MSTDVAAPLGDGPTTTKEVAGIRVVDGDDGAIGAIGTDINSDAAEEHYASASSLSCGDKSLQLERPDDGNKPAGVPDAVAVATEKQPDVPPLAGEELKRKKKRGGRLLESMKEKEKGKLTAGIKGYGTNETPLKARLGTRKSELTVERERDRSKSVSFEPFDAPTPAQESSDDDWTQSESCDDGAVAKEGLGHELRVTRSIPASPSLTHMEGERLTRGGKQRRKPRTQQRSAEQVGKVIKKGDSTYELMFDILLGIRYSVSMTTAKKRSPLQPPDYYQVHRLNFPSAGSSTTPAHPGRDFAFRDYAPKVFRHLREKFGIDSSDYLMSLTNSYELSQVGSPGKSGSLFYYTPDSRYMLKTVTKPEAAFLKTILRPYYEHIMANPSTLIIRFYGFHRVQPRNGPRLYLVVMGNIFAQSLDIHERYDLKGSTLGRTVGEKKLAQRNPKTILKDLDFQRRFILGPKKREAFFKQIEADSNFLAKMSIMDYSLLVGINTVKKEHEKLMQYMEKQGEGSLEPSDVGLEGRDIEIDGELVPVTDIAVVCEEEEVHEEAEEEEAAPGREGHMRDEPHPEALDRKSKRKSRITILSIEGEHEFDVDNYKGEDELMLGSLYVQDDGGFGATDENDRPVPEIYFMGIIDILQPYNYVKRFEHNWKSLRHEAISISAIDPVRYAVRFRNFFRDKVSTEGAEELQQLYEKNEQFVYHIQGPKEKKRMAKLKKKEARDAFLEEQREEREREREKQRMAEKEAKEMRKGIRSVAREIKTEIRSEKKEARKSVPLMDAKQLKKLREKEAEEDVKRKDGKRVRGRTDEDEPYDEDEERPRKRGKKKKKHVPQAASSTSVTSVASATPSSSQASVGDGDVEGREDGEEAMEEVAGTATEAEVEAEADEVGSVEEEKKRKKKKKRKRRVEGQEAEEVFDEKASKRKSKRKGTVSSPD